MVSVLASAALVAGTLLGASVWDDPRGGTGPADVDTLDFSRGVRAFADPGSDAVHLGGRRIPLEDVPGLTATGVTTPSGVLYLTPRQELRLLGESGEQRVLRAALGVPRAGFTPSAAFDPYTDTAVVLSLTARSGRAVVAAYDVVTGDLLDEQRLRLADATRAYLGGADHGVAAVNYRGAGVLSWRWGVAGPATGELAPSDRRVVDMRNRVALVERLAEDPYGLVWRQPSARSEQLGRFRYRAGRAGDRLDPSGTYRVSSLWSRPADLPRIVSAIRPGGESLALSDLPDGRTALAFDSDGSVLAAVSTGPAARGPAGVYDCDPAESTCELIGEIEVTDGSSPFLIGTAP